MYSENKGTKTSLKARIATRFNIPFDGKLAKVVMFIWNLTRGRFPSLLQRYGIWTTDTRKLPEPKPKIAVEVKIVPDENGYWFYAYIDGKMVGRRFTSAKRVNVLYRNLLPSTLDGKVTFASAVWIAPEYRRFGISEHLYSVYGQFWQDRGINYSIGVIALDNMAQNQFKAKQRSLLLGIGYHLHITDRINFYWQGKELKKAYEWFEGELAREKAKEKEVLCQLTK